MVENHRAHIENAENCRLTGSKNRIMMGLVLSALSTKKMAARRGK